MRIRALTASGRSRETGVGLIEVMIALLIISIGLLAILGLQITSKKANRDAVQRTTAAHLAYDLAERVRANPEGRATYLGNTLGDGTRSVPSPTCSSSGTSCSGDDLAEADLYQWEQALDGVAEVRDANNDGDITDPEDQVGGLTLARACLIGPGGGAAGMYELVIVWRGTDELPTTPFGNTFCNAGLDATGLYGTGDVNRRAERISFYVSD